MSAYERALLERKHGRGVALPPDVVDDRGHGVVLVFAHRDERAARAYAASNIEHHGHPARAELREAVGWVCVIDLRPAIAELDAARGVL